MILCVWRLDAQPVCCSPLHCCAAMMGVESAEWTFIPVFRNLACLVCVRACVWMCLRVCVHGRVHALGLGFIC